MCTAILDGEFEDLIRRLQQVSIHEKECEMTIIVDIFGNFQLQMFGHDSPPRRQIE